MTHRAAATKEGSGCTFVLSVDFDAESLWTGSVGATTLTPLSRGSYGARVGLPRLAKLLRELEIPATFFVPGEVALRYPALVRQLHEDGHEIGNHGFSHASQALRTPELEEQEIRKGTQALVEVVGVRPVGYRSPAWDLTSHTVNFLVDQGFLYDSSMMGDDFSLYFVPQVSEGRLVELPIAWELDDAPYFMFNLAPYHVGLSSPERVYQAWLAEFDGAYSCGGTFTLTLHPQVIGRWPRIKMLEKLLRHIKQHYQRVDFVTAKAAVDQFCSAQRPGLQDRKS